METRRSSFVVKPKANEQEKNFYESLKARGVQSGIFKSTKYIHKCQYDFVESQRRIKDINIRISQGPHLYN